jgi:hypothetical protein
MTPRFLHVANGSSTTMTLAEAGVPGAMSIWADPLHDGPVPGGLSDEQLLEVRRGYLDPEGRFAGTDNDLRRWRDAIAADDAYDELVLWYEHDLFDQLTLIQLLTWTMEPDNESGAAIHCGRTGLSRWAATADSTPPPRGADRDPGRCQHSRPRRCRAGASRSWRPQLRPDP